MSWLKKLFGGPKSASPAPTASSPQAEEPHFPALEPCAVEELRPGLRASIYAHELSSASRKIPCWTYLSQGLQAAGQKELVFCLRREPGENEPPREIVKFFGLLEAMARDGDRVELGELTQFSEAGLFAGSPHRTLAYLPALPLPGIPLPERCLLALLLSEDEFEVAKAFGSYRITTRLGRRASHYPHPPWSERQRSSVVSPLSMQASVLNPVARLILRGALIGHEGNTLQLQISQQVRSALKTQLEQLRADEPLALLGDPRPDAAGRLVWEEGQQEPAAITPPQGHGSGLGGGFVLCLPGKPADLGRLVEDGYALELQSGAWQQLRTALTAGKPWALAAQGRGLNFSLTWMD